MWQNLLNSINDYWGWAVGALGLTALISWLPGGGAVVSIILVGLRAVASFMEMIAPIVANIFSGIIWFWKTIIWPGLLDILDSWTTMLTVIFLGGVLWVGFIANYKIKQNMDERALYKCQAELVKAKRNLPEPEPEERFQLPWPFNFK
jgi:hypothetical protein